MGYKVRQTNKFKKRFEKLDNSIQAQIRIAINDKLRTNPKRYKNLRYNYAGKYSIHIGTYRVIYIVEKDEVILLTVGLRDDIYKVNLQFDYFEKSIQFPSEIPT